MYDVTHVRMIETRLCDQKFLRMGKERLRSETSWDWGESWRRTGRPVSWRVGGVEGIVRDVTS